MVAADPSPNATSPSSQSEPSGPSTPTDPNRIGIVFVHGIGNQAPCETLLDWSGPIVKALIDWREDHKTEGVPPGDPVISCEFDPSGRDLPFLELEIPAYGGLVGQTWLITEAWWAQATRRPTVDLMSQYLARAVWPIAGGIRQGYTKSEAYWSRLAGGEHSSYRYALDNPDYQHSDLVQQVLGGRRRDLIYWFDWGQMTLTSIFAFPIALAVCLFMIPYGVVRKIPVKAIQDSGTLKSLDNYLTGWFGGLPNITRDNVQSANVRARLARAIRALRERGCDQIVVVAHSGGAIVSFETLCDDAYRDLPVDKLITLGEGLDLAWRIDQAYPPKQLAADSRLRGDLPDGRTNLRWVNFWSTYDPAPAGPINRPPETEVRLTDHTNTMAVNRMSILEDHGGYWDNDEDFLIPLLRNLDTPRADASESRFFRDISLARVRSTWRRQRVAVLAAWRWVVALEAGVPLVVTSLAAAIGWPGVEGPGRIGNDFARFWKTVPFHELIVTPINGLADWTSWPAVLQRIGQWALGVAVVVSIGLAVARAGVWFWSAWDRMERKQARMRVPRPPRRFLPFLAFTLLSLGGLFLAAGAYLYMVG